MDLILLAAILGSNGWIIKNIIDLRERMARLEGVIEGWLAPKITRYPMEQVASSSCHEPRHFQTETLPHFPLQHFCCLPMDL